MEISVLLPALPLHGIDIGGLSLIACLALAPAALAAAEGRHRRGTTDLKPSPPSFTLTPIDHTMMRNSLLLPLLLTTAVTAGEVPFGHADWKASPTDPVGFAGQGNNWYPGATPPLTWSHSVDGQSKNILWKVPHPGWTDAQPLVIGKRVVGVYSPHHVVCYDADTGKILWQDELKRMTLPERGEVGQPAGAVPEAAKAAKEQLLFERGLALGRMEYAMKVGLRKKKCTPEELGQIMTPRLPMLQHMVDVLTQWQKEMPDQAKALDEVLSAFNLGIAGNWAAYIGDARLTIGRGRPSSFGKAVEAVCRIRLDNNWQGSVSDVMASPVSDGEIVAVTLGFGQVAAYELATGKRLWAWRDPELNPGSVSHCASPCLWKDLVLVPAAGKRQGEHSLTSILGIDKRTGVVRWETLDNQVMHGANSNWGQGNTHGNHMSPHLMRLPGGKSLLVHNSGNLIDPETGASLGQLPRTAAGNDNTNDDWGSGFICSVNGTLFKGWGGDCRAPLINAWPLSLGADGKVVIAPGYPCQGTSAHGSFALSDRLLVAGYCDPATGKPLKGMERERLDSGSIAGRYLLSAAGAGSGGGKAVGAKPVGTLVTKIWDLSDPTAPKKVGENTLTIPGFTPDISAKHFPKAAELYPTADMEVGHVNYQGIGFNFAVSTSGLTAIGSRIYLHSPGMLICIGEK